MRTRSVSCLAGLMTVLAVSGVAFGDISSTFNFTTYGECWGADRIGQQMSNTFDASTNSVGVSGDIRVFNILEDGVGLNLCGKGFTFMFNEALTSVSGSGWVNGLIGGSRSFHMYAVDASGGQTEVFARTVGCLDLDRDVTFGLIDLTSGATAGKQIMGLRFSDSGINDIGLANLTVTRADAPSPSPVPAPGAALLVVVGLGAAGWMKRRIA